MQLIGMLDSPYVRRVAVTLQLLGLPFTHRPISVFRSMAEFNAINPVVKVPTLVCDDGTLLMDSTLIIDFAEVVAATQGAASLMPSDLSRRQRASSATGYALAACEKSVQILYEQKLRPVEKQHEPWLARVTAQMRAAYQGLESTLASASTSLDVPGQPISQAELTAAIAWRFTQILQPGLIAPAEHPTLASLSVRAEALPAFERAPHGEGIVVS